MRVKLTVLVALALAMSAVAPAVSTTEVSDTLSVVKDDEVGVSNVDVAVRLSETTPFSGDTVVISRDDEFADALASGVLQADAPLLLVPTGGPLPAGVLQRMTDLAPQRAVILGGVAAVSEEVAAELIGLGLTVERRAGASRFDTAVAIAEADAPTADTVMLARAFPASGSTDPTQAFADTLAAGGLAAQEGWPILLTESDNLTAPTAEYLARSGATRVLVLGGTAAISEAVFDTAVGIVGAGERVAGPDRFGTATEIAKVGGAETAADVTQVLLVEGTGGGSFAQAGGPDVWAAGFAAANRAAVFDAPVLLTAGGTLPASTAEFLAPGVAGDPALAPLITCTVAGPACEDARVAAGLPAAVAIQVTPDGGALAPGAPITVAFGGYTGPATVGGTCLATPVQRDGAGDVQVVAATALPQPTCTLLVTGVQLSGGTTQTETVVFTTGQGTVSSIDPPDVNGLCALAVDPAVGLLYAQSCSVDNLIHRFTFGGGPATPATVLNPTGASNDIDFDVIDQPATILGRAVPAGSLLVLDSEQAPFELLVLDPTDGAIIAGPVAPDLPGPAVGVAWDEARQQIVALIWTADLVSRLDAATGQVVVSFSVAPEGSPAYDVFFGDIEVACDGTLVIVSNSNDTVRTLGPDGAFVSDRELTGLPVTDQNAGVALDDTTGTGYVATNGGTGLVLELPGLVATC